MTDKFITMNGMWLDFDQIVSDLSLRLSLADKKKIARTPENLLIHYHHGLGTWIRNSYGLWVENPLTEQWRTNEAGRTLKEIDGIKVDVSPDHPDAVSTLIIKELWERVQYLR
jgi:hypothetical protein